MSRTLQVAIPVTLLLSALALSACATKPEPAPVVATSQAPVAAEKPAVAEAQAAPVVAAQPVASPEPAPKHAAKKLKKKAVKAKPVTPKAEPPAPVAAPAPVVEPPPVCRATAAQPARDSCPARQRSRTGLPGTILAMAGRLGRRYRRDRWLEMDEPEKRKLSGDAPWRGRSRRPGFSKLAHT